MAASSEDSSYESSDEDRDLIKQIIAVEEEWKHEEELFTQKQEIILLHEVQKYREKYGEEEQVRWDTFHEESQLRDKFSATELSEKCRRLEKHYRRNVRERSAPAAADHRDGRIFQLSQALWGRRDPVENPEEFRRLAEFLSDDDDVPRIIMKHWGVMGKEDALHFEKRLTEIRDKELSLLNDKLFLKRQICHLLLDLLPAHLSATPNPHRPRPATAAYDPQPSTANESATLQNGQEIITCDKKRNGESAKRSSKENRRRKQP